MDKKTILAIVATGAVCLSTVGAGAAGNNAQKDATTKFERPRIKRIECHTHKTNSDSIKITYVDYKYVGDQQIATNQKGESRTTLMKNNGSYQDKSGRGQMKFGTSGRLEERTVDNKTNISEKRYKYYRETRKYRYEYIPDGKMKREVLEGTIKCKSGEEYATRQAEGEGSYDELHYFEERLKEFQRPKEETFGDCMEFKWKDGDLTGIEFKKEVTKTDYRGDKLKDTTYLEEYLRTKFIYGEEENKYGIPAFIDPYMGSDEDFPFSYDPYLSSSQLVPRHLPKIKMGSVEYTSGNNYDYDYNDYDKEYWGVKRSKRYYDNSFTKFPLMYDWQTDEKTKTVRCIITRRRNGETMLVRDTITYQF